MGKREEKAKRAAAARALLFGGTDDDAVADNRVAQRPAPLPSNEPVLGSGVRNAGDTARKSAGTASTKGARAPVQGGVLQPEQSTGKRRLDAKGSRPGNLRSDEPKRTGGDSTPIPVAVPAEPVAKAAGVPANDNTSPPAGELPLVPPVGPKHHPRKHAPGTLAVGTSVWYRGERFWVERVHPTWHDGCYVRITARPVHPDPTRASGTGLGTNCKAASFCVHADMLELAPTVKNIYAAQPSMADVARKERSSRGEKDVGDPIAVMLREAKSLDDVYRIGADYLGVAEADLRAKYGHLNPGQQRMNVGNRMRGQWRKEQK